jgi:hypothetical protein
VDKDLRNIGLVLKFGKDSVCRAPVSETKVNNINAVGNNSDTVYHYENPFCYILINSVIPESERNNLHEQIQRVSISQSRNVELKSALQQCNEMTECHIGKITAVRQKEKNPAQIINEEHQREIAKENPRRLDFYPIVSCM